MTTLPYRVTETTLHRHFVQARKAALADLVIAARVLPDGWKLTLAVGWGLHLTDQNDDAQVSLSPWEDDIAPRLPKGVRDFVKTAALFQDLFGPENEIITRKGLTYPRKKQ